MYNFFLDGVQLPIAPAELTININNKNETITLIDNSEINLLKKAGLTDFSFKILLPNVKYPFAVYPNGFQPATYYTDKLEALKLNQKPFYFLVNRMKPNGTLLFDTNILVSLESYGIYESAENGFDLEVDIELKQYRTWGTKKVEIITTAKNAKAPATSKVEKKRDTSTKSTAKTHKVVKGDTLWGICKKYFGTVTDSKINEIVKLNNLANPNLIKEGQVLKLG
ncbi:LysM domain-containing protein [Lysinibacillus sp. FSL L8-0312]|uniref:LysM peptidoglycan-binding domain-containing protein n=1 Tax=Lysinibacillus sp. FSL L8-0312 TaxID=2921521 RepID=UPI0030F6E7F4